MASFRKKSMTELERLSTNAMKNVERSPLALIMDDVRSALNVGSAFRTADAFALEKIHLCGITAVPPHKEILKTALGSTDTVAWEYFDEAADAVRDLKANGWQVWAIEQAQHSVSLESFVFPAGGKLALVFGNEVDGVSDEVLSLVDGVLEIPQFGSKHSLNIAVCVGIVSWELVKQWKFGQN
jgi:23S rRNA (guanosine2251-2'-O)-methyltransferase